jgi:hypothetical protein
MAGNAGFWLLPQLGSSSKTPGHEYGHGNQELGSTSHFLFYAPNGMPNIMAAENQVAKLGLDPNSRTVTESDISQIGLSNLLSNGKTHAVVGGIKSNQIYSQDGSYGVVSGGDSGTPGPVDVERKN